MTLEDVLGSSCTDNKMHTLGSALETLLVAAQTRGCLTVGVYESAKLLNVDPDSVLLCVLAADADDSDDVALQIHFTLLRAFCCENHINIVRVSGLRRLAQILEPELSHDNNGNEARDLHCLLVTNPPMEPLQCQALSDISSFCSESRGQNLWVPALELQAR